MRQAAQARVHQLSVSPGGIPKHPIPKGRLDVEGLEGDGHNDRRGHGGPARALCLFALETVHKLQAEGHHVFPGALGENVTTEGLDFSLLGPGTRLRIGAALVQVTSFTTPCINVAGAFRDGDFTRVLHRRHPSDSRVYAEVIEPGEIAAGDGIRVERSG